MDFAHFVNSSFVFIFKISFIFLLWYNLKLLEKLHYSTKNFYLLEKFAFTPYHSSIFGLFYTVGDNVREKLRPFPKVTWPLSRVLGLDSKPIRFRGCPEATVQL